MNKYVLVLDNLVFLFVFLMTTRQVTYIVTTTTGPSRFTELMAAISNRRSSKAWVHEQIKEVLIELRANAWCSDAGKWNSWE